MTPRRSTDPALRLIAITPGQGAAEELVARGAAALTGGATALWVRERQRPEQELREILVALQGAAARVDDGAGAIVVSGRPDLALELGLYAAQLGFRDTTVVAARRAFGGSIRLGYSAHDPLGTAEVAAADYITLSPVFPTTKSNPRLQATPLGLARFAALAAAADRPVVALGGVNAEGARDVIRAGACGVAVMGAIFSTFSACSIADVVAAAASLRAGVERALDEVEGDGSDADGSGSEVRRGEA